MYIVHFVVALYSNVEQFISQNICMLNSESEETTSDEDCSMYVNVLVENY